MKTLRLSCLLSCVMVGAASAQTLEHTVVLDSPASHFEWTILSPLGPIPGIPDNGFDMSGTMTAQITAGDVDPFSIVEVTSGDLYIPYIKGEIPGIIVIELKWGANLSIETDPVHLGGSDGPAKSGSMGQITLISGEVWVYLFGGSPQIIPIAGGVSDPFPVLGHVEFDSATGNMHLNHPIYVEFELSVSGVPMFFIIEGNVVTDYTCPAGENYCATAPNSVGPGAVITGLGSSSFTANALTLATTSCPPNSFGLYFYGPKGVQIPLGDGWLCVGSPIYRLGIVPIDASGRAMWTVDANAPPDPAGQVAIGEDWFYQLWYRDPGFGTSGYNFSDGLVVNWRL